jgi:hypothetical protein
VSYAQDRSVSASEVGFDDLASVLASVISSVRTAEEIRDGTGVLVDDVQPAIALLKRLKVISEVELGRFHATQLRCAGVCRRVGEDVRREEVVINRSAFRWTCAACWQAARETDGEQATP